MNITETNSIQSRFAFKYERYLQRWCQRLEESSSTIFAISRKGPRLLELLVQEKLLDPGVLSRVITEHAIPFYKFYSNEEILLIDDSVQFGSTFNRIRLLLLEEAKLQDKSISIVSLPFAASKNVCQKYKELVTCAAYHLDHDSVNSFIDSEITSFKILGKPYDIEHPILHIKGDFSDIFSLNRNLERLTESLIEDGGKWHIIKSQNKIALHEQVHEFVNWTLLYRSTRTKGQPAPEFAKLRIFLNPEADHLTVAAICPQRMTEVSISKFASILPPSLQYSWNLIESGLLQNSKSEDDLYYESMRSRVIMANYFHSFIFLSKLQSKLSTFLTRFTIYQHSLQRYDLQLLVGNQVAQELLPELESFLESENIVPFYNDSTTISSDISVDEEKIPGDYLPKYQEFLNSKSAICSNVAELISYLFYAQHLCVEVPLRQHDNNGIERLRFGVTLPYLLNFAQAQFPDIDVVPQVHEIVDSLIDSGSIVPKYVDISKKGNPAVWTRLFRIGEDPIAKRLQVLIFLGECLVQELDSEEIPAILLEKFSVLCTTGDFDLKDLSQLEDLQISKGYSLYGARSEVSYSDKKDYYLDFGIKHQVLERVGSSKYQLVPGIRSIYPLNELQLDRTTQRQIRDIAKFSVLIHSQKGVGDAGLVTLTTLASQDEYYLALSAELELWLSGSKANIHTCLRQLFTVLEYEQELTNIKLEYDSFPEGKRRSDANAKRNQLVLGYKDFLAKVDSYLFKNANITAQVRNKTEWYNTRKEMFKLIDQTVKGRKDELVERVWEDIAENVTGQKFRDANRSAGLPHIVSALRIAHSTTSFLRDLLTYAGHNKPSDFSLLYAFDKLIRFYKNNLLPDGERALSDITDKIMGGENGRTSILDELTNVRAAISESAPFEKVLKLLRPVILEIVERVDLIFTMFSPGGGMTGTPETIPPPKFVLMWDVIGSSDRKKEDVEQKFSLLVNERIDKMYGKKLRNFVKNSGDDGNGLICDDFRTVLGIFELLCDVAVGGQFRFRAGCDVNLLGDLHYYRKSKTLTGLAYIFTTRITNFFKDISGDGWVGEKLSTTDEPSEPYLIVGELAWRTAKKNHQWIKSGDQLKTRELNGEFSPRVLSGTFFPFRLTIVTKEHSPK